jgi:hypothetical protein
MACLEDVFGVSLKPVLSYTERDQVDGLFRRALQGDRHIVIYGSSKQGKSSLRQKHLPEDKCIPVGCGPRTRIEGIYQSILRQVGIKIESVETVRRGIGVSGNGSAGFKATIPFVGGADGKLEVSGKADNDRSLESEFVGYDLGDAQSISELLKKAGVKQFIVLENFHYLPMDTQRLLAFDLRTFHDAGIRFIILGVWREANLLLMHNGDLGDRVIEIPVEPWGNADFTTVVRKGCDALNIELCSNVIDEFFKNAYGNVGLLQEFLKTICEIACIKETSPSRVEICSEPFVKEVFERKLSDQRGRLLNMLQGIAGRSRVDGPDPLILPYYLARFILTVPLENLIEGIHRRDLLMGLQQVHHRKDKTTIRAGDVSHLLSRLPAMQEGMQPPLLHYDSNQQRLKVVDTRQFFVLAHLDRREIVDEIPFPVLHGSVDGDPQSQASA